MSMVAIFGCIPCEAAGRTTREVHGRFGNPERKHSYDCKICRKRTEWRFVGYEYRKPEDDPYNAKPRK